MSKYEIMLIVDPKADASVATNLLNEVFGKDVKKAEKLELTELAYPINKSKHAQYVYAEVETNPANIAEFTRKANILKTLWRQLVINLDSEKGYGKEVKVKKTSKRDSSFAKKPAKTEKVASN
ncbi:30S ribosomal protein S6 [Mycoplasmopsis pullorum]|uniref:Small ribosomal subunit protein bS6 n=1 Tax=Mycoplasmopsis pullorum TaxID=48003 RepID=A0A1L4FSM8_9BACT|nr:30S ribosomal protein S6 [Mycoplasmopsis pullorum]APJ38613.1 30S ribosomal protein S6 [Mycoplasmopsis pullorum]TNK83906.1 30S ribosomal protein S6 [Mycoplasmopsis pullorum]TNK92050.1 30S ribosomal protein S6 [Mycoplasmopsis pullorum]